MMWAGNGEICFRKLCAGLGEHFLRAGHVPLSEASNLSAAGDKPKVDLTC